MFSDTQFLFFFSIIILLIFLRFLTKTSLIQVLVRCSQSLAEKFHVYQFYRVPQFDEDFQQNRLYHKVSTYLNSLASLEDSNFTNLYSGTKSNDIFLHLDANQTVDDTFLSARVSWTNEKTERKRSFVLKMRRKDKRRTLRSYLQHIISLAEEIEQRKKEIRLFMNLRSRFDENGRWVSVPFTHPATMDTIVMDAELKNKVKSDVELFLKSKQYYQKLGRVWKRSYLLYGPSGTGKSSFVAAMARFLSYNVYDIDLTKVSDDSDLKMLLLQTTNKSLIVIEHLDRFLSEKSMTVTSSGLLNFMDGIVSCCGEERVMVFTMTNKEQIDRMISRPGRIDVHINLQMCDFSGFKTMAHSHLGVKDHKLFPKIEEIFQNWASISPAEASEIMISNRTSPNRALKSVVTALQTNGADERKERSSNNNSSQSKDDSVESGNVFSKESVHTVKEFRKLYGLLRMGSRRKEEPLDLGSEKEDSRHGT